MQTQVFVIRIWLEPRELPHARPVWRGEIEHLPSGLRRGLNDLTGIRPFVERCLRERGVPGGTGNTVRRWTSRWRQQ